MIKLTERAVEKILELMAEQDPKPKGLRVAVIGGGCSGLQYHMKFWGKSDKLRDGLQDKVIELGGLQIFVDQMSLVYLDGVEIDYVETLEGSGFKFNNPNVKSQCGCGQSFTA